MGSKGYRPDPVDKKILLLLQENSKITNAKLSAEVGLSAAPTLERVRRLEQHGFIERYHAQLSRERLGFGLMAFVEVTLGADIEQQRARFLRFVEKNASVCECHHVAGHCHFVLKVLVRDHSDYEKWLSMLNLEVKEHLKATSMLVLSSVKEHYRLVL